MIDFCKAGVDCVAMGRGRELSSFILLDPGLLQYDYMFPDDLISSGHYQAWPLTRHCLVFFPCICDGDETLTTGLMPSAHCSSS